MRLLIRRDKSYTHIDKQTMGNMYVFNDNNGVDYSCGCLELPWLDNEKRKSCIPEGEYKVIKHNSPKYKECFWIQDVPARSEILIHDRVNFVGSLNPRTKRSDLLGCIAPFERILDIDKDGIADIAPKSSTVALQKLLELLPEEFTLKIEWV